MAFVRPTCLCADGIPRPEKTTIWLDIKLILQAIGIAGIAKTLKREAQIKKKQSKTPMLFTIR